MGPRLELRTAGGQTKDRTKDLTKDQTRPDQRPDRKPDQRRTKNENAYLLIIFIFGPSLVRFSVRPLVRSGPVFGSVFGPNFGPVSGPTLAPSSVPCLVPFSACLWSKGRPRFWSSLPLRFRLGLVWATPALGSGFGLCPLFLSSFRPGCLLVGCVKTCCWSNFRLCMRCFWSNFSPAMGCSLRPQTWAWSCFLCHFQSNSGSGSKSCFDLDLGLPCGVLRLGGSTRSSAQETN